MGMAASQARFLGLTARKTNIEYEGQQINQQRTTLANQSANYYNDLLGMSVPVPPSVDEYTKTVYTFNDGALTNQVTSLIAQNDGKYTLSYLSQWEDDFTPVSAATSIVTVVGNDFKVGAVTLRKLGNITANPTGGGNIIDTDTDIDNETDIDTDTDIDIETDIDTDTDIDDENLGDKLTPEEENKVQYAFYEPTTGFIEPINKDDVAKYSADNILMYLIDESVTNYEDAITFVEKGSDGELHKVVVNSSSKTTSPQVSAKNSITPEVKSNNKTTYSGNLEYLDTLSEDQKAKLKLEEEYYVQLLNQKYGKPTNGWYVRYVENTSSGIWEPYFYNGDDLANGVKTKDTNNIISNVKCYTIGSATKTEEIKGIKDCFVEKDSTGRYISISIPDANGKTVTYSLTTSTITDQDKYDDAMNQYEYEKYQYDQAIQEINSKIEIIQSQDKNLELRLKQLDTEQSAVQTEMDAVEKVIEKNTESSFKTFG